jgi:hypothetical protein
MPLMSTGTRTPGAEVCIGTDAEPAVAASFPVANDLSASSRLRDARVQRAVVVEADNANRRVLALARLDRPHEGAIAFGTLRRDRAASGQGACKRGQRARVAHDS